MKRIGVTDPWQRNCPADAQLALFQGALENK